MGVGRPYRVAGLKVGQVEVAHPAQAYNNYLIMLFVVPCACGPDARLSCGVRPLVSGSSIHALTLRARCHGRRVSTNGEQAWRKGKSNAHGQSFSGIVERKQVSAALL